MKIALVQFNPTVGDLIGNADRIINFCHQAVEQNADAIVFPELAITGYPPEDLLFRDDFIRRVEKELERISIACPLLSIIIGYPEKGENALLNSVAVLQAGELVANYRKQQLPNYGVFDEMRYFKAGKQACVFKIGMQRVSQRPFQDSLLTLCHDPERIEKILAPQEP